MILEKEVFERYKPNKDKCRPTVNPDVAELEDRDNLEVACLIFNLKDIYWTQWPEILDELDPDLKILLENHEIEKIFYSRYFLSKKVERKGQIIMQSAFIEEKQAILCSKNGKMNALLLLKWHMLLNLREFESPGSWAELNNPYLIGSILQYDKSDIKFYYRIAGFREYLKKVLKKSDHITVELHFVHWPEELKTDFYYYNNYFFKQSDFYKIYKRDQKEALDWLIQNEQYSVRDLQEETKQMIDKVEEQAKSAEKKF